MGQYASLVETGSRDVQNAQDLATIWGEVRAEIADHDAELVDAYAVLGQYDFIVIFEAADRESAYKTALTFRRHGLDGSTMDVMDTEAFGALVDDL